MQGAGVESLEEKKAEAYSIDTPSGIGTGSKGQQTALHPRTEATRTMAENSGWTQAPE